MPPLRSAILGGRWRVEPHDVALASILALNHCLPADNLAGGRWKVDHADALPVGAGRPRDIDPHAQRPDYPRRVARAVARLGVVTRREDADEKPVLVQHGAAAHASERA